MGELKIPEVVFADDQFQDMAGTGAQVRIGVEQAFRLAILAGAQALTQVGIGMLELLLGIAFYRTIRGHGSSYFRSGLFDHEYRTLQGYLTSMLPLNNQCPG